MMPSKGSQRWKFGKDKAVNLTQDNDDASSSSSSRRLAERSSFSHDKKNDKWTGIFQDAQSLGKASLPHI